MNYHYKADEMGTCIMHVQNMDIQLIPDLLHCPVPMQADL